MISTPTAFVQLQFPYSLYCFTKGNNGVDNIIVQVVVRWSIIVSYIPTNTSAPSHKKAHHAIQL